MVTLFALVKLLHVLLGAAWFGALLYDWLFTLQHLRATGGVAGLRAYQQESTRALPFWAIVGFGTLLIGFATAWRLYGTANPLAWPDVAPAGGYITASLFLVMAALALGISQVPPSVAKIVAAGDDVQADLFMRRASWLGAVELVVVIAVVVLMVGAGLGGY